MYKLIPVLTLAMVINFSISLPVQAQESNAPSVEDAEVIADLLEQIAKLTAILEELKAQKASLTSSHILTTGSSDADTNGEVTKLQQMLIAEEVYPEGIVSGYFGTFTGQAVVALKQKYNILPATPTFEQSTKEAIQLAKVEAKKVESSEFFNKILDAYEENYGYRELLVDESYLDFVDTEVKINTVLEMVYDYVNREGSVGDMSVTTYVENENGLFGFENEFDFVGTEGGSEMASYIRLIAFDDEDPFINEEQKEAKEELLGEWQRIKHEDSPFVTLTGVFDQKSMQALFGNHTFVIDVDDPVRNDQFSEIFDQEVYSYEVTVDLDGMESFFVENNLIEAINSELKFITGHETYAEARKDMYDIRNQLFVSGDRMFGIHSSFSIDFQDEEGNDVTLTRNIEWVADKILTDKVDILPPKEYIKVN